MLKMWNRKIQIPSRNSCVPGKDVGWGCLYRSAIMLVETVISMICIEPMSIDFDEFVTQSTGKRGDKCTPSTGALAVKNVMIKRGIDCVISPEQINREATFPLLILCPSRIEPGEFLGPEGSDILKYMISLPWFCGAVGGLPSKATFIYGVTHNRTKCVDPHFGTLQFGPSGQLIRNHDPSFLFAFLLRSVEDQAALTGALHQQTLSIPPRLIDTLNYPYRQNNNIVIEDDDDWGILKRLN